MRVYSQPKKRLFGCPTFLFIEAMSMQVYKSYKYRLYPTLEQIQYLSMCFGHARLVWNKLVKNFNSWSATGPNRPMSEKTLKDDPQYSFLKDVPAVILQQKANDFDEAKRQHFSKTRKKKLGRPKFKNVARMNRLDFQHQRQR